MSTIDESRATRPGQTRPGRRFGRGGVHGGWALMVVAGLIAAVANLSVLTRTPDAGLVVLALDADANPGTPVAQLLTREETVQVGPDVAASLVTAGQPLGDGLVLRDRLQAGDLLRHADLVGGVMADGGVMSIPIHASRAAGGLVAAGDTVDVLADVDGDVGVVVAAAAVIAVGADGGGLGSPGQLTVTLAVTDEEALAVSRALRSSEIDLVRVGGAS